MTGKLNIAIMAGGDSSESVISVQSAEQVCQVLDKKKFNPHVIKVSGISWVMQHETLGDLAVDKSNFTVICQEEIFRFDRVLIMIHGTPGEDGKLQGYFDLLRIPYTSCGVLASALTFNKQACKVYLASAGILSPKGILVKTPVGVNPDDMVKALGLPCFVKPNNGGSSFGVTRVNQQNEIMDALSFALKEDTEVLVEEFIKGVEVTCGAARLGGVVKSFPVTEIVSKKEFFDYEAKYTDGMAEEITPARIPDDIRDKIQQITIKIYELLDCKGIVRVDYIIRSKDVYFLEVNTIPGMSRNSIIPKQIKAMGESIQDVLTQIIEEAC
jgi:D-alanine-D-alanine ligase